MNGMGVKDMYDATRHSSNDLILNKRGLLSWRICEHSIVTKLIFLICKNVLFDFIYFGRWGRKVTGASKIGGPMPGMKFSVQYVLRIKMAQQGRSLSYLCYDATYSEGCGMDTTP